MGVEAVVQRQQGVPTEGDDKSLLLGCQDGGTGLLGAHGSIGRRGPFAPFLDRGGTDTEAPGRSMTCAAVMWVHAALLEVSTLLSSSVRAPSPGEW